MADLVLPPARGAAKVFHVDGDGIYVAFDSVVYRYSLGGGSETHLVNAPNPVQAIHSDGNLLFVNHSTSLYARLTSINKASNTLIAVFEKYIDSVFGSSIAPSSNRIFGRTQGISPSDITYASYDDTGQFTGTGASPYHGSYANANVTWVFPNEARVVDDAGIVYSTSDLTYLGSFGGTITDLAFHGIDVPIVLRNTELISYTSALLPSGSKNLAYQPFRISVAGEDVITFSLDTAAPAGITAREEPLADLAAPVPGLPSNPDGLPYTPNFVFQDVNGIVNLFHKGSQSLFRWDPSTQRYGETLPILGVPSHVAYAASLHRLYLAYPDGLVRKIELGDPNPAATPFFTLPRAPLGLCATGNYLFAVDDSGSWETHYSIRADGTLVDSVDWNYFSESFTWSEANQKIYFFRDGISPNDILWEEINANGTAYPGEPPGGIRNKMDSPYHGEDSFVHPIRVAPDGSVAIIGSGRLFNGQTLVRQSNPLPNSIIDAAWLGTELHTTRTINNLTQHQQWVGATRAPGLVKQYPGVAHRLLAQGGDRLVSISISADGRPSFYLLDPAFEIVAPLVLAKPGHFTEISATPSQVSLAWADVSGETGYRVERKTGTGGSWSQIATTATSISSFIDTTVGTGNDYFYRVTAFNGDLVSASSDELRVSITGPQVPGTLSATPMSASSIALSWENVANETGYKIERATTASGPWTALATTAVDIVTYLSTSLSQNTLYFYRVRSSNGIGDSGYSAVASARTLQTAPSTPFLSLVSSQSSRVTLSWSNVANEDGYQLERAPASSGPWTPLAALPANTTTYIDTGVLPSTTYYYRVRAYNGAGGSGDSSVSTTTPAPTPPIAPTGLTLRIISGSQTRLSWSAVVDATAYHIERRTDNPLSWEPISSVASETLLYNDTGLESGLQYWYRVRAGNAAGSSAASAEVTGIPVDLAVIAEDDFDPEIENTLWASITSGTATDGGPGFLGSNALWFGSSGTRAATTRPLNLSDAGYLEFSFRAGNQIVDGLTYWNNSESGENVVVEYSLDGSTWVSFQTLATQYPNHSTWTSYYLAVPPAAVSPSTRFRWRQIFHSGGTNDTWALENLSIYSSVTEIPEVPQFLVSVANSATAIALSWEPSEGAANYRVERSLDGDIWVQIASTISTQTFYNDINLSPATSYLYRIRASNQGGSSEPGNSSLATTLSPIGGWRLHNYGTSSAAGESSNDAVGPNGLTNLVKFAFNLDNDDGLIQVQRGTGTKGLPSVWIHPATQRLRVEFVRRKSSSNPGITYTVEFSNQPSGFAAAGYSVSISSIDAQFERVVWEDSVSTSMTGTRFVRVEVSGDP